MMTNREFFTAISANTTLSAELTDFAKDAIAKLDARNAKRANSPSKAQIANEPIKAQIVEFLGTVKGAVASEIAVECGVSTQKVSGLCRLLVNEGVLSVTDAKIPKKGTQKYYSLAEKVEG